MAAPRETKEADSADVSKLQEQLKLTSLEDSGTKKDEPKRHERKPWRSARAAASAKTDASKSATPAGPNDEHKHQDASSARARAPKLSTDGFGNFTHHSSQSSSVPQPPSSRAWRSNRIANNLQQQSQPLIPAQPITHFPRPTGPSSKRTTIRRPPSMASGGVPTPTPSYLTTTLIPPTHLPSPSPLLVILDLNGTLLYRPNRNRSGTFIERAHARAFLTHCLANFHVAIWSSSTPRNVDLMCKKLFTEAEEREKLVAVWGRDKFGLSRDDYGERVMCYKRLGRVWGDEGIQGSFPAAASVETQQGVNPAEKEDNSGGKEEQVAAKTKRVATGWDQSNTVLIDDSVEKGKSEPHNLISIPEFEGTGDQIPDVLLQVQEYLDGLVFQSDVSAYMRATPFRVAIGAATNKSEVV